MTPRSMVRDARLAPCPPLWRELLDWRVLLKALAVLAVGVFVLFVIATAGG